MVVCWGGAGRFEDGSIGGGGFGVGVCSMWMLPPPISESGARGVGVGAEMRSTSEGKMNASFPNWFWS